MSTRMDGIVERSLFSSRSLKMDIIVGESNRYRTLAERLPWVALGAIANRYRARFVDIHDGRALDLRLHLGALIAQSMNGWTDRETEEMVACHAGVRLLCGLELSRDTIDHTSIEAFRSRLGPDGVEAINSIVVKTAERAGFTGSGLCSSDTTVQEAPIAYPTEVGHMKNIAGKLVGIGSKIRKGLSKKLGELGEAARRTARKIHLFTDGKTQKGIEKKKELAKKLQRMVARMHRIVGSEVEKMTPAAQKKYREALKLFGLMLSQIRYWIHTGHHRKGKIISLWALDARAIVRNKASKTVEFGRRWIITRLTNGYVIGTVCQKLGSDADSHIMTEVLEHFERTLGALPDQVVYDRGGDGQKNHRCLKENGIRKNCIFRKGKDSLPGIGRNTAARARRERALSEASIALIKHPRYGFNKPRARSSQGCILKGQAAILGANLIRLTRNWSDAVAAPT